jgi:tetratricopeptide (TPR) repeat protein
MGYCYQKSDKAPEAIKQFQQATKLQPGYVTAWNNLGDALEKQGRWQDAQPAYEAALELEAENETAKQAVQRLRNKAARMSVKV